MKIKTIVSTEVETEVNVPCFTMSPTYAYYVISDTVAVEVEKEKGVKLLHPSHAFRDTCKECTREDFMQHYDDAIAKIWSIFI